MSLNDLKEEVIELTQNLKKEHRALDDIGSLIENDRLREDIRKIERIDRRADRIKEALGEERFYDAYMVALRIKQYHDAFDEDLLPYLRNLRSSKLGKDSELAEEADKKIEALEANSQRLNQDIINSLATLVEKKSKRELEKRPEILIDREALVKASEDVLKWQSDRNKETGGLFSYRRIDGSLLLTDFHEFGEFELPRKEGSADFSAVGSEMEQNVEERRIAFHSHPRDANLRLSGADLGGKNEGDIKMMQTYGEGTHLLAKPSHEGYSSEVLLAAMVLVKDAGESWQNIFNRRRGADIAYLPIKVVEWDEEKERLKGEVDSFSLVRKYNKALSRYVSGTGEKDPYLLYDTVFGSRRTGVFEEMEGDDLNLPASP